MPLGYGVRFSILKRDGFTCQYCGQKAPDAVLHVDHVKPRAEGGSDEPSNLVAACSACNIGKNRASLFGQKTERIIVNLIGLEAWLSCYPPYPDSPSAQALVLHTLRKVKMDYIAKVVRARTGSFENMTDTEDFEDTYRSLDDGS